MLAPKHKVITSWKSLVLFSIVSLQNTFVFVLIIPIKSAPTYIGASDNFFEENQMSKRVLACAEGFIRYFSIFYDQALDLNLHFQSHEKLSEGEDVRVWPTLGSGSSSYRVMVSSQGILPRKNYVHRVTSEVAKSPIGR